METTTTNEPSTRTWYDVLGREIMTKSDLYNKESNVITEYNKDGTIKRTSLPYFRGEGAVKWQDYEYDVYKRNTLYRSLDLRTRYQYNTDNSLEIRKPDGNIQRYIINRIGQTTSISSYDGDIAYTYDVHGKTDTITAEGSETIMEYDSYGNQIKLTDPNAGVVTYDYNAFGELIKQTDNNGNTFIINYDNAGRITSKECNDSQYSTEYTYYTSGKGNGLLQKEEIMTGIYKEYEYNKYGEIIQLNEKIGGHIYTHKYSYDNHKLFGHTYPSGYLIRYIYDNHGFLTAVISGDNKIWELSGTDYINELGQIKNYYICNGNINTTHNYNSYFELENIKTKYGSSTLFDYQYKFNHATGNLDERKDNIRNMTEKFQYDDAQRLKRWEREGDFAYNMGYELNGNIIAKNGAGAYTYESERPHAVKKVIDNQGNSRISNNSHDITYNPFLKTETIIGTGLNPQYSCSIVYGPDLNRKRTHIININNQLKTKIYSGLFEREIVGNQIKDFHYINTGSGNIAVHVKYNGEQDTTYYLLRDHLGSIMKIVRPDGTTVEENNYDPWGNLRNPNDWSLDNVNLNLFTGRGYTGHEHLPEFQLINMNGRMYDPVISRVLSPDNYIQDADNAQSYNRYTYCLNNPLKYNDPSGMLIHNYSIDSDGRIKLEEKTEDKFDMLYTKSDWDAGNFRNGIKVFDQFILDGLATSGKNSGYKSSYVYGNPSELATIFLFAADNSNVEWLFSRFNIGNGDQYAIGSVHKNDLAISSKKMGFSYKYEIAFIHSHPSKYASVTKEYESMGWGRYSDIEADFMGYRRGSLKLTGDSKNVYIDKNNYTSYDNYLTYFPHSGNIYQVRGSKYPAFIKNIQNHNYNPNSLFWGTLNGR